VNAKQAVSQIASSGTILIVEDEPLLRLFAVEFLENAGFVTLEARNADEAMTVLISRPDVVLVLTDVNMPGSMDGVGLASVIRSRWPHIKIILVSGNIKPLSCDLPLGSRFIGKPYRSDNVLLQVRSMIGLELCTAADM
jgi:two-component system, response regulator PdtaR